MRAYSHSAAAGSENTGDLRDHAGCHGGLEVNVTKKPPVRLSPPEDEGLHSR